MSRKAGFTIPPHVRAKMSASMKGRTCSEETRAKIGAANRGRHPSVEARERMSVSHRREKSYRWNGGRTIDNNGYVRISTVGPDGRTIRRSEHIVIAEKALGRNLKPGEMVHHINGIKTDNRHSNLLICAQAYHKEIEARMVRLYQEEHFA